MNSPKEIKNILPENKKKPYFAQKNYYSRDIASNDDVLPIPITDFLRFGARVKRPASDTVEDEAGPSKLPKTSGCSRCHRDVPTVASYGYCLDCAHRGRECGGCGNTMLPAHYRPWVKKCVRCFRLQIQTGGGGVGARPPTSERDGGKGRGKDKGKAKAPRDRVEDRRSEDESDLVAGSPKRDAVRALNDVVREHSFAPTSEESRQIPATFLLELQDVVGERIADVLRTSERGGRRAVKWSLYVGVEFARVTSDGVEITTTGHFNSTMRASYSEDTLSEQFAAATEEILLNVREFQREGSGWSILGVVECRLKMAIFQPFVGGSFIATPAFIADKKAVVNVVNEDDHQCFKWSILAGLHPQKKDANRVRKYVPHMRELNMEGISFPTPVSEIGRFERQNASVSVNVFGYEEDEGGVFPIRLTEVDRPRHVDLLLISEGDVRHYAWVKSLSRLLCKSKAGAVKHHYCRYCLQAFATEENHGEHMVLCRRHGAQKTVLPTEKNNLVFFRKEKNSLPAPFVIYADLESFVTPLQGCGGEDDCDETERADTRATHAHTPSGYGYAVVSCDPARSKPAVVYRGERVIDHLIACLLEEVEDMKRVLKTPAAMKISPTEQLDFDTTTHCYLCTEWLGTDRVRDHCHLTGVYRGAAHNRCNLQHQHRAGKDSGHVKVPVVFHNLKGYDANHLMCAMGRYAKTLQLKCLPLTVEKYICFDLGPNLHFIDSLQFLNASLNTLVANLASADGGARFAQLNAHFRDPEEADLLRRKGVYPYSHVTEARTLEETDLPPKEAFFNDLSQEHVSDEDYSHARRVWERFGMRDMGDYHDLYLKTDVLLLADVFENFRSLCLDTYKLDPAHYVSAPSLSWDSMLKSTKVQLELITDPTMFLFVEAGMRGGVSSIHHREARANNPHLGMDWDPETPTSYITCWDANNLYGWAMSQALPIERFGWVAEEDLSTLDVSAIPDGGFVGYILEVDLDYPRELHDEHNDYPLAPENVGVSKEMLSPYTRELGEAVYPQGIGTTRKLIPHLGPRRNYVIHYRNLKQYLSLGMRLMRVHRAVSFRQTEWLKPYIDLNTGKRQTASNAFEKDFYKLMNNSIYGKSCENLRKRRHVELVSEPDRMRKLCAKPSFKNFTIFQDELVGVEMLPTSITLDKPSYVGMSILEVSKTLMYAFHYGHVRRRYGGAARLLFTDTDSLCYHIRTEDLHRDMSEQRRLFDMSNLDKGDPYYDPRNAKVIGKMKNELATQPALSFVGLRPKMYSIRSVGGIQKNTAKGVSRAVIRQVLKHELYERVLRESGVVTATMRRIGAQRHKLHTMRIRKVALSAYDDKRYVLPDGITTLAYGHRNIALAE